MKKIFAKKVFMDFGLSKRILSLLVVSVIALITAGCNVPTEENNEKIKVVKGEKVTGMKKYASDDLYSLWADGSTGEVRITDKNEEILWTSYPDMSDGVYDFATEERRNAILSVNTADYYNNRNLISSYTHSVEQGGLTMETVDNGVKMYFDFPRETEGFMIPVGFSLMNSGLKVKVYFDEITNYGDCTITTIGLMPYWGAALNTDEGYILIPDGTGSIIRYTDSNTKAEIYSQYVYGKDPALTPVQNLAKSEKVRLPVFGVNKNGKGFLAVIDNGDCEASVIASQPGKISVFSSVYADFIYTPRDTYTISDKDFVAQTVHINAEHSSDINPQVTYLFLDNDSDYLDMAKTFREYLMSVKGFAKTQETGQPVYIEFFGGAQKKESFLGLKYNKLQVATTFSDVESILNELSSAGAEGINAILYGFQKKGMYASDADSLSFDGKYGGIRGFNLLKDFCYENEIGLYPAIDFFNSFEGRKSQAARLISGRYLSMGLIKQNTGILKEFGNWYFKTPSVYMKQAENFLNGYDASEKYGLFILGAADTVYSDYNSKRFMFRDEAKDQIVDLLKKAESKNGNILLNGGNFYAVPYADAIIEVPSGSTGFDIESETVPFYQMALHGFTVLGSVPINEAADPQQAFLDSISFGNALCFRLTSENPNMLRKTNLNYLLSTEYRSWHDDIVYWSKRASELSGLAGRFISDYEAFGDVTVTTYDDGTKVYVNRSDKEIYIDNIRIASKDFSVRR